MKVSIITATYNAAATITDCLKSVRSQQLTGTGTCGASPLQQLTGTGTCGASPLEHIIIDGASTDNTLEIVSPFTLHPSPLTRVFSEPDNGIYDAMNKGIRLATGDIIGILNADDFYASPDVLANVAAVFEDPAVEACYGDLEYIREPEIIQNSILRLRSVQAFKMQNYSVVRYWQSGPFNPDKFKWGWMPPHPTFFVRRSVYEKFGLFRLDMGSAADYELMLRLLLKHRITTAYIPEVLVRMRVGGASNATLTARTRANRMDRRAWEVNGLKPYPWTLFCKPLRKVGQYVFRKK